MPVTALGYVGVRSDRLDDWADFACRLIGMQKIDRGGKTLAFRMDDRMQRLLVSDEPGEALAFMGFEVAARSDLRDYAARLDRAGVKVDQGSRELADRRFVEDLISADRLMTLPHDLPITVAGYREMHRYMLQDVYDWAGEYRTVDTGRTGPFCKAKYIARYMDARFAAINAEDNLRGLSLHQFASRAAEHICELNAIHCFLDGNGRTQRAFLEILARQAGHEVDVACIDPGLGTRPRSKATTRRTTDRCKWSLPARS
jgi:fido (protein-threonine AMPylation protein)